MKDEQNIMLASIAAVADNGVIGRDNALAWRIPSEFAYFRATTLGKPVIMGRKTFESLGRPLPQRTNIVITRDAAWRADGVTVCHSLKDAIAEGKSKAVAVGADTVFVIGGAEIYREAMPLIDVLYLTEVHLSPAGDVRFPDFDRSLFDETLREHHPQHAGEQAAYTITVLHRKAQL